MDSTMVFGTISSGSNPDRRTKKENFMLTALTINGYEDFLRQTSKVVDFADEELSQNLKDIREYCSNHDLLYALACIQLGIPKRIVYIKSTKPNDTTANDLKDQVLMINPKILSQQGKTEFWEACVSGLDNFGLVERPYKITVEYQDEAGNKKTQAFEGFSATVVSHELDHLDGIFHMDRAKELIQRPASERIEFRKSHPYKIISKTCEFEYPSIEKQ